MFHQNSRIQSPTQAALHTPEQKPQAQFGSGVTERVTAANVRVLKFLCILEFHHYSYHYHCQ